MLLNEDLKEPAERGQPAILLRELKWAYLNLALLGEAHLHQPIALTHGAPADGGHSPTPKPDPGQQQ